MRSKPACVSIILFLVTIALSFPLSFFPAYGSRGIVITELEKATGKTIGTFRALIIGIDEYRDSSIPDLKTPVNDARELSELLKGEYGFSDVTLLIDSQADASNIIRSLRELVTRSENNDAVLIYYAGHGELDKLTGAGYWVPSNAKAGDLATYLENGIVQRYIKAIPARHVLLVADSCFSGILFGESRDLPPIIDDKFYATLFKEKSRWGMTSGNLTPVSDEGSGGHSIFAYQLLKTLKENEKPYLTPREIYQKIGPVVRNNSEQMPITKPIKNAGDEGGEFVFIRVSIETPISPAPMARPESLGGGSDDFERERHKLVIERRRIEGERQKIEEEIRLETERRKLEEAQQRLEEEKKNMEMARLSPNKPGKKDLCNRIIGTWFWDSGCLVTIEADGSIDTEVSFTCFIFSGENVGTWKCEDPIAGKFTLTWGGIFTDEVEVSKDGRKLSGENAFGISFSGSKRD